MHQSENARENKERKEKRKGKKKRQTTRVRETKDQMETKTSKKELKICRKRARVQGDDETYRVRFASP